MNVSHSRCAWRWRVTIGLVLIACSLFEVPSGEASLTDSLRTPRERSLARAMSQSIGRTLPVLAASSGVVFVFDPRTNAFVREHSLVGQLYLERPDPIGWKAVTVSLSYQYVHFDTFDGKDLDSLSDVRPPILSRRGTPFTVPHYGLRLTTQEAAASVTYGVSEDGEVNLTVPVLYSTFGKNVVAASLGEVDRYWTSDSALGVGDLFLRGKYRVLASDRVHAAAGLVLRIPTGDPENFQGTGDVEVMPMVYVATTPLPLGHDFALTGYVNAGFDIDASDLAASEARWGVGLDCAVGGLFTGAIAVLGRNAFSDLTPSFAVPRQGGGTAPLFGLEPGRPDFYDLSVGGRVNLWRDRVFALLNAIVPLNRDGFRANVIPLVGVEGVF